MSEEERQKRVARRTELRAGRERGARQGTISPQIKLLETEGVSFEILPAASPNDTWLAESFPWGGGATSPRIHWEKVAIRVKGPRLMPNENEERQWMESLTISQHLEDGAVTVLSDNGLNPGIRVTFAGLRKCPRVVSSFAQAWAFNDVGGWVFEYRAFGDGWWWGRAETK